MSYPLKLIFAASFQEGIFPDSWKKANIVPFQKKDTENLLKNMPISFLPFSAKIFFINCYSGFSPDHFLYFSVTIYCTWDQLIFDCSPGIDGRGVFLDNSKAFDKVRHQWLIFNVKSYGVRGRFLDLMTNYLGKCRE